MFTEDFEKIESQLKPFQTQKKPIFDPSKANSKPISNQNYLGSGARLCEPQQRIPSKKHAIDHNHQPYKRANFKSLELGISLVLGCWSLELFPNRFASGGPVHDLPIKTPARKTKAPPRAICSTADTSGVSMNRCRIHEMMPSSTSTTHTATSVATFTFGSK
jgi:hypothetical protein